jgi:hypothetical protein
MDRSNHYEVAFEGYLQDRELCYVAVDETRRSQDGDFSIKSADFLIFAEEARLVVDVKGRRFPGGPAEKPRRVWECWSEREGVEGLVRWAAMAGPDYRGVLVFAYHLQPTVLLPDDTPDLFFWRGQRYLFRGVAADEYRRHMRVRSQSWDTVSLRGCLYRNLVHPFSYFTEGLGPTELAQSPGQLEDSLQP